MKRTRRQIHNREYYRAYLGALAEAAYWAANKRKYLLEYRTACEQAQLWFLAATTQWSA